jgi:hypothetical protein
VISVGVRIKTEKQTADIEAVCDIFLLLPKVTLLPGYIRVNFISSPRHSIQGTGKLQQILCAVSSTTVLKFSVREIPCLYETGNLTRMKI